METTKYTDNGDSVTITRTTERTVTLSLVTMTDEELRGVPDPDRRYAVRENGLGLLLARYGSEKAARESVLAGEHDWVVRDSDAV